MGCGTKGGQNIMGPLWKGTGAGDCSVELNSQGCTAAARDAGLASWVQSRAEPAVENGPGAVANGA